jgi:hypothetical protein
VARRILSITSAPGWAARFNTPDEYESERIVTLAVWALVESDGAEPEIVGLVQRSADIDAPTGRLGFADEVEGFDGYSFQGLGTKPIAF